jgi:iron-sulfur cluster assembly 1
MTPITITPQAEHQLNHILSTQSAQVIRVSVNNKGCSGHSYVWDLITPEQIHALDHQVRLSDGVFVVDHKSVLKMWGSTLDYVSEALNSQFVWQNPHVKVTCGCGLSVGF